MAILDPHATDTDSICAHCDHREAYPAIVTADGGPQFRMVCGYCGAPRVLPAPARVG